MWCEFPAEDLSALVDGELPESRAREALAHVEGCLACREELARFRRVDPLVLRSTAAETPATLRARLVAAASPPRRLSLRTMAGPAAAAAALLLLVGVEVSSRRGGSADARIARQATLVDSLELDAASLRLLLAAEEVAPSDRSSLDGRIDQVLRRLERLRREGFPPEQQGG